MRLHAFRDDAQAQELIADQGSEFEYPDVELALVLVLILQPAYF